MKLVIYSTPEGTYHLINEVNYRAGIREAIPCPMDCESPGEVIEYFCANYGTRLKDFFVDFRGQLMSWQLVFEIAIETLGKDMLGAKELEIYNKYKEV